MAKDEYVLRSVDRNEISRLGHQYEVWRRDTNKVFEAAGFSAGDRLLDLGCGPGFLTRDLAELVGSERSGNTGSIRFGPMSPMLGSSSCRPHRWMARSAAGCSCSSQSRRR
jgi:SAM-dependent methyltransferase